MTRTIDPMRPGATPSSETGPSHTSLGQAPAGPLADLAMPNPVDLSSPAPQHHSAMTVARKFAGHGSMTIGSTTMTVEFSQG